MATPWQEITKTDFKENYNVVKILTDKIEIMKQLQSFNSKNHAVAFAVRKQTGGNAPKWFTNWYENELKPRLEKIELNQSKDHNLLMKVIKLNNLKTK